MPISPAEQKDLDEMNAKRTEIKIACVDAQLAISHMTEDQLKNSGFKSHADGYQYKLKMAAAKINDLTKAHLKKWPD